MKIIRTLTRGEFNIIGFRNKDLRNHFPKKNTAQISRILKRLKLHGIIKKASASYKYSLTKMGKEVTITAMKIKVLKSLDQRNLSCHTRRIFFDLSLQVFFGKIEFFQQITAVLPVSIKRKPRHIIQEIFTGHVLMGLHRTGNITDVFTNFQVLFYHILAENLRPSRRRKEKVHQHSDGGGFPGTIAAQETVDFSLLHGQAKVFNTDYAIFLIFTQSKGLDYILHNPNTFFCLNSLVVVGDHPLEEGFLPPAGPRRGHPIRGLFSRKAHGMGNPLGNDEL